MARPVLIINGHDYAPYVEELTPSRNDLDADGSGRDVQTGEMFRTRIAVKQKWEVKLLRLNEALHRQLIEDIAGATYPATVLDPVSGAQNTRTFYTSSVAFGAQRYNRRTGEAYYDGTAFNMTEK